MGSTFLTKGGTKPDSPSDAQVAEAYLRSSGPSGTRERLNNFLTKLETTWQLFNRSSTDSADGELPKEGRLALLDDTETPTPETLKMLRARFKQQAQKPEKGSGYLFRAAEPEQKKAPKQKSANANQGPKDSPRSDRSAPRAPAQRNQSPAQQPKLPEQKSQTRKESTPRQESAQNKRAETREGAQNNAKTRFEAPRVEKHMSRETPRGESSKSRGSVLGRKPGSSTPSNTARAGNKPTPPQEDNPAHKKSAQNQPRQPSLGERRPQLMRRPGGSQRGPLGTPTSRSFLGSTQSKAQLRNSDASGRPGQPSTADTARQPVFSQSLGQINPRLKKRQVSGQMPVHSSFLDECHEESSKASGPIRLSWNGGKGVSKSVAQRMFAHRARLQLTRGGGSGRGMGSPINLASGNSAALATARTDVSTRIAGAAIGSLLEDLYEEEDVENLDEETAVTSLGLILRLGGEFTYKHSTRVLDLAMELADEVGVRDKQTRKEIKFGTMFRDVGEFDILIQGDPESDNRMKEFSGFLQGQDMLRAGLLHDIGKVKIPPEILYKPGKLTAEEYEIMKMHPIWGEEIVRRIAALRYLCPTIRGHHERWDGKGYPDGLSGERIPLAARIISVADVFDALAAERPYKRGMAVEKVSDILAEGRGSHFDPFLVDSFLEVLRRRYPT